MAPHAHRAVERRRPLRPLAARPRLRALLRLHGRRHAPVLPGPGLRQPPGAAAQDARGGLPPHRGSGRSRDRLHRRQQAGRARQAVLPLLLSGRDARAPPRAARLGRQVQGAVRRRLGRLPREGLPAPARARRGAAGDAALRARSRRRRMEGAARRREAALRPDDGGVRRIPRAHRSPHRTPARLPGQDRTARRHAHHAGERQRRQRRGGAARLGQREPLLQQRPRDGRRRPQGDRRSGRTEVLQPLSVGLGLGGERALPPLEARDLPRRLQRSVRRPLAEGDQGAGGDSHPVRAHHRHAADGAGGAGPRGADADPRRDAVTDSRRLVRARAATTPRSRRATTPSTSR